MAIDKNKNRTAAATELRRQAEEEVKASTTEQHPARRNVEAKRLVHELEIHQIELEMQNEELSRAKDEVEKALGNYTDLYDFAPAGYLTLDHEGAVLAANLTVAGLLGIERSLLLGRRFGLFVAEASSSVFSEFLDMVFAGQGKHSCELTLTRAGNATLFVHIEAIASSSGQECRVAVIDITERKRIADVLRTGETQFAAFHANVNAILFYLAVEPGGNFRFTSVNRAFLETTGLAENQVVGRLTKDVIPQESHDLVIGKYLEAIRTKKTIRWEESTVYPTGKKCGDVAVTPIFDAAGTCCQLIGIVHDITARRLAEEGMRLVEHQLAEAQRIVHLGSWQWDAITDKVTGSDEFYRIFGCFFSSYAGFLEQLHPDDRDMVTEAVDKTLAWQQPYNINYRIVHADGTIRVIHAQGEAIVDNVGRAVQMLGTAQDITERRQLEELTAHLASFPELNPNPVLEVDCSGRITFFNPATVKILKTIGMDEADIAAFLPSDMDDILASWDSFKELTVCREINIKGRIFGETIFLTPQAKVARIYTHDVTARKQAEGKLQKALAEMESKVLERTQELTRANTEIRQLQDRLQAENLYLQQEVAQVYNFGEIIGQSHAISQVFQQIEQVAPMQATVLILGETGTGKGVVARAIHSTSARKDRPMITVNCTALPANLIESELFGRERGAFTGADARQIGRFELADGGSIFLDEIGEMPLELQPKLLRVVQDGEFERLGSSRTIKVNVRIIAASNRNLKEEIKAGRFRQDLFYRLNVFPIMLPPLRQRERDILLLINHFVAKFNKKLGKNIQTMSPKAVSALQEYDWPGNVRELEAVVERAVIISQGNELQILERFHALRQAGELAGEDIKALVDLEHDHILKVLEKTNWRIQGKKGAAMLLGINASTLRSRMKKYGILRQPMNGG